MALIHCLEAVTMITFEAVVHMYKDVWGTSFLQGGRAILE